MPRKRDRCSECLAEFALRQDGTIGWHLGDGKEQCIGVGAFPAVMRSPVGIAELAQHAARTMREDGGNDA